MLNYVRSTTGKVTDLQPGSVTRTILEAPAAEIEELYVQMFNGIKEAIPVAVYNSINFPKLAPKYASGNVTIIWNDKLNSFNSAVPPTDFFIPKGTTFLARDGRIYQALGALTWPKGQASFTVPVQSILPGYNQNLASGEINASPLFNPDLYDFSNTDMTGGADTESDKDRDTRFADYIASLSRGTETALLYGARSAYVTDAAGNITEAVTRASLSISTGKVQVNIWGSNGSPSKALLDRANQIETGYVDANGIVVPGFSAAGISCDVVPMRETPVDAEYRITLLPGYTLDATMKQAIRDALSSLLSGIQPGTTVYLADIQSAALLVPGVKSALGTTAQNIVCGDNAVLVNGTIKIDELQVTTP